MLPLGIGVILLAITLLHHRPSKLIHPHNHRHPHYQSIMSLSSSPPPPNMICPMLKGKMTSSHQALICSSHTPRLDALDKKRLQQLKKWVCQTCVQSSIHSSTQNCYTIKAFFNLPPNRLLQYISKPATH